ncbi:amino acid permease [Propionigenium maris DSM 9537]|uniref:Amino acid permease n=1 Tax=Propionigenium maris DSM 9537 TaxID=1123000 RepID=A0A9W6GHK7_9FUSO|nr:APC family permease [Propionigenium maris]GLI55373.1 amino acid permease [Propionigenium maris DSM 9537]
MKENIKAKYGIVTAFALVMGTVIGVGIFFRAPAMTALTGGDFNAVLTAWVVGILMVVAAAIVIAEISSMDTDTGGVQSFLERSWSKRIGFGAGFTQTFLYLPANLALISWFVAGQFYVALLGRGGSGIEQIILAVVLVTTSFLINIYQPKLGGAIQVGSTFIKIIPLLLVGIFGIIFSGDPITSVGGNMAAVTEASGQDFITKVAAALAPALFALEGWIFLGIVSKEVKNPEKNVPRAIAGGLILVALFYLLFTFGVFKVATAEALGSGGADSASIVVRLFGSSAGRLLNIAILISALGVLNSFTLAYVRAPYALAERRDFPMAEKLRKVDIKTDTPIFSGFTALIISLLYMGGGVVIGGVEGIEGVLGMLADITILIFYVYYSITILGVLKLRRTEPEAVREFRAPMVKLLSAIAIAGTIFGGYGLFAAYAKTNLPVLIFYILFSLTGFIIYTASKDFEPA